MFSDLPTTTTPHFDALISLATMPSLVEQNKSVWENAGFLDTYLVLRPERSGAPADPAKTAANLKSVNAGIKFTVGKSIFLLEPLPSLHLYGKTAGTSARQNLYILLGIAPLILVLAITNYVSLTTPAPRNAPAR